MSGTPRNLDSYTKKKLAHSLAKKDGAHTKSIPCPIAVRAPKRRRISQECTISIIGFFLNHADGAFVPVVKPFPKNPLADSLALFGLTAPTKRPETKEHSQELEFGKDLDREEIPTDTLYSNICRGEIIYHHLNHLKDEDDNYRQHIRWLTRI